MVGKTALNKEMKHLNGAYFRTITDNREYDMKLFLLILTSILSIGSISWKDPTDISQNNDCIFRDTLVGYVNYDNVLDSIYIEKTSEYRYDDNDGMKEYERMFRTDRKSNIFCFIWKYRRNACVGR